MPGFRHGVRRPGPAGLIAPEDALQDTLLSAWQGLAGFEGRASIRTWLYRVATSRCLDALRSARRRPPVSAPPAGLDPPEPSRLGELLWLEPCPDVLLEGLADSAPGPEARYEAMESISLAFITALQLLPPRQRAALILRDVLGFHASEAARILDTSEESVTSALKRARAPDEHLPSLAPRVRVPVHYALATPARPAPPGRTSDPEPARTRAGNKPAVCSYSDGMPLTGEYEPSAAPWARKQVDQYERSGGTEGTELNGRPVIILTSVGARTGKLRKNPLMRVEHDGEYAVVASLGGAPKHPVWYYNLTTNPQVELQDGPVKKEYRAREVTGGERATWWERAIAAWPDYAAYQKKTTRTIPVFVLTPVDA